VDALGSTVANIERRIVAVRAVRQVVHALWALSRAQLPLAEAAAAEAGHYLDWIDALVSRLVGAPRAPDGAASLHVVLGPERAFSGPLAKNIVARLPAQGRLGLVGTRLCELARRESRVRGRVVFELPGAASHDDHQRVALDVAEQVLRAAAGRAVLVHHPSGPAADLVTRWLLAASREAAATPPETFTPLPQVIAHALFEGTSGRLAVAAAETLKCEVIARIEATEKAKSACEHKLERLEQQLRTVRKEEITNELLEVVAGSEAARASAGRS
jgi:F0F1-type ATP synthase gamma subunit